MVWFAFAGFEVVLSHFSESLAGGMSWPGDDAQVENRGMRGSGAAWFPARLMLCEMPHNWSGA